MTQSTHVLPDGLAVVVKRDCPTCVMVEPVLRQLAASGVPFTVLTQDDPTWALEYAHFKKSCLAGRQTGLKTDIWLNRTLRLLCGQALSGNP